MAEKVFAGKYKILGLLGEGSMGKVYRAEHIGLGRHVALKVLKTALDVTEEERERLLAEARNCARIEHPCIVSVYDVGASEDHPYIAMELVVGNGFHQILHRGCTLARGLAVLRDVCLALECAHEAGIIHRDLKPENVLVPTAEGACAKVVDWGLSRAVKAPKRLTQTGIVLGTPTYMAPEQITSKTISGRVDLYALGVMLFEVATGRAPFEHEAIVDVLSAHITMPVPDPRSFAPQTPDAVADLALRLLAKKPADRPAYAVSVREEIEAILDRPDFLPSGVALGKGRRPTEALAGEGRPVADHGPSGATQLEPRGGGSGATRIGPREGGGSGATQLGPPSEGLPAGQVPAKIRVRGGAVLRGGSSSAGGPAVEADTARSTGRTRRFLVFAVLLCTAMILLGYPLFLRQGSSGDEAKSFAVKSATLDEEGRLIVRFSGTPPTELPLEIDEEGASLVKARRPELLYASKAKKVSLVTSRWTVVVDPPIVERASVRFKGRAKAFPLDPRKSLHRAFGFLEGLKGKALDDFASRVGRLRTKVSLGREQSSGLATELHLAGVSPEAIVRLRQWMPRIAKRRPYLNATLARRLEPLLRIECYLLDREGMRAPWLPAYRAFGMVCGAAPATAAYLRQRATRLVAVVAKEAMRRSKPNPYGRSILWLHTPEQVAVARKSPAAYVGLANTMSLLQKEHAATIEDWFPRGWFDVEVKARDGVSLPLRDPHVHAIVSWFSPKVRLLMKLGEGSPYRILHTARYPSSDRPTMSESRYMFSFPVNPADLRRGTIRVTLWTELIGAKRPPHGLAFHSFALTEGP